MGILDRLSRLIRSNINDLIARAENPEKMLSQIIEDMRRQLAQAKQEVVRSGRTTRTLEQPTPMIAARIPTSTPTISRETISTVPAAGSSTTVTSAAATAGAARLLLT